MPVNGFDPVVSLPMAASSHGPCSSHSHPHSPIHNNQQINGQPMDMECASTSSKSSEQMMDSELTDDFSYHLSLSSRRDRDKEESDMSLAMFERWSQGRQTAFVEQLIQRMSFHQHEHLYSILMPMLQRDFITALPSKYLVCISSYPWCAAFIDCCFIVCIYSIGSIDKVDIRYYKHNLLLLKIDVVLPA